MSGLDIPDTVDASTVTDWSDDVDVVVVGFGIGRRLCGGECGGRRCQCWSWNAPPQPAATAMKPAADLLSRRWDRRAAGDRASGQCRGDVQVPRRDVRSPSTTRSAPIARAASSISTGLSLGIGFERSYYPEEAVIQPNTEG